MICKQGLSFFWKDKYAFDRAILWDTRVPNLTALVILAYTVYHSSLAAFPCMRVLRCTYVLQVFCTGLCFAATGDISGK